MPVRAGGSEAHVVVLQQQRDKFELLEALLNQAGFWFALEQARFNTSAATHDFNIIIKPDLSACELTGSLATDPQLVEHLIDLLHDRGYTQVTVVDSRNSFDLCLENRDVQILADMLGYRYVTPEGRDYDILDLGEALSDARFDDKALLRGTTLSDHWLTADFRIAIHSAAAGQGVSLSPPFQSCRPAGRTAAHCPCRLLHHRRLYQ